jgi:hypothetical protein
MKNNLLSKVIGFECSAVFTTFKFPETKLLVFAKNIATASLYTGLTISTQIIS